MQLILKYTLRNIREKPLRTVVLLLCLTAVSLTFSLCLTIHISARNMIENQLRNATGKTDIMVFSKNGSHEPLVLPEGTDALYLTMAHTVFQLHNIDNYKYVQKKGAVVLGVDTAQGHSFGMLPECSAVSDDEVLISPAVAGMFRYEIGDTITLPCADGSVISLKVKEILKCEKYLSLSPMTVITTQKTADALMCMDSGSWNQAYIDVKNNSGITEASRAIAAAYPDLQVDQVMGTQEINEQIAGLTSAFFVIFAVVLVMIVFIVSAFAKNIAIERLSVIGTLRSIGAEKTTSAFTLLLECAVYGILGGLFGSILFFLVKDAVVGNLIVVSALERTRLHVPLYIPAAGTVLAAAVSCICSFAAILGAAGMPLRDIIFGNKDTSYRLSRAGIVAGAFMLAVSLMLHFMTSGFGTELISLAGFAAGICLLLPLVLTGLARLASGWGAKCPVLRLAVIQSGTKKTSVVNTVICTVVIMLTAAVYVLTCSVDRLYSYQIYDADMIITELSEKSDRYRNLNASEREYIYCREDTVKINGGILTVAVFGYDGFTMFHGIQDMPEKIEADEIVLDREVMKRLGISEGEILEVTLKQGTVRPLTLTLKAAAGCDSVYYDMRCNAVLLSLDTYKSIYHDYPSVLLLKTDSPSIVRSQMVDKYAECRTAEEHNKEQRLEAASILTILRMLILLGTALAVISSAGNQTLGFEQRKHELAVLRACGMDMRQLSRMLLAETILSVLIADIGFLLAGGCILNMLAKVLRTLEFDIPIHYETGKLAALLGIISITVILTALLSIRSLKHMHTAEQLKQE